jgi:hypothetical protein
MNSCRIQLPLTEHELFWIEVIRLASKGRDPVPTLRRTQQLRRLFADASVQHGDRGA